MAGESGGKPCGRVLSVLNFYLSFSLTCCTSVVARNKLFLIHDFIASCDGRCLRRLRVVVVVHEPPTPGPVRSLLPHFFTALRYLIACDISCPFKITRSGRNNNHSKF